MIAKSLPLLACMLLGACAVNEPSNPPTVALDCGDAQTGSHLARRKNCVPRSDESREEARKQAETMRDERQRTNSAASGRGP